MRTCGCYVFGFCYNWRERATFAAAVSGSIPADLAQPDLGLFKLTAALGPLIHPLTYRESFVGCVAGFSVCAEISSHPPGLEEAV